MSNVLARNRSVSELEFYKNAVEIRAILTRYFMNEKHIPKRWRPVFTFPGIELIITLMNEIIAAYNTYPYKAADLRRRRLHQTQAIIACEQIVQHLQWIIEVLEPDINSFAIVMELIDKEIELLKDWRRQNKLLSSETTEFSED